MQDRITINFYDDCPPPSLANTSTYRLRTLRLAVEDFGLPGGALPVVDRLGGEGGAELDPAVPLGTRLDRVRGGGAPNDLEVTSTAELGRMGGTESGEDCGPGLEDSGGAVDCLAGGGGGGVMTAEDSPPYSSYD